MSGGLSGGCSITSGALRTCGWDNVALVEPYTCPAEQIDMIVLVGVGGVVRGAKPSHRADIVDGEQASSMQWRPLCKLSWF